MEKENNLTIPMRREGAEGEPGKFDIIQDPPGGVAAVEVEHMCVAVLPLALDGVIVREKRVSFKASEQKLSKKFKFFLYHVSPVLIKSNSLSISGEDMKVKGLDGVTWVVV